MLMKDDIIIYVSSRNNYDMLEHEVLNRIDTNGFEFINVDDNSSLDEVEKGKEICSKNNIVFLENMDRGVQMATHTLIEFINENRPNCKWVICFQHDIYPITPSFFEQLSLFLQQYPQVSEVAGILGFNVLDGGNYTHNSKEMFDNGEHPFGMIGMAHLSVKDRRKRWICPTQNTELLTRKFEEFSHPFYIEFPMWAAVGISVDKWNTYVRPTNQYHFHLWLPDVAMQLNYRNIPSIVLPHLYCYNDQSLKEKYSINKNSAQGAMQGNEYHFGEYSNFKAWQDRWGWHYEDVENTFIQQRHKDNLIGAYFNHNMNEGPYKTIPL